MTVREARQNVERILGLVRRFVSDCQGSTAIEYVAGCALIGLAVVAGMKVLSGSVSELYGEFTAMLGGS